MKRTAFLATVLLLLLLCMVIEISAAEAVRIHTEYLNSGDSAGIVRPLINADGALVGLLNQLGYSQLEIRDWTSSFGYDTLTIGGTIYDVAAQDAGSHWDIYVASELPTHFRPFPGLTYLRYDEGETYRDTLYLHDLANQWHSQDIPEEIVTMNVDVPGRLADGVIAEYVMKVMQSDAGGGGAFGWFYATWSFLLTRDIMDTLLSLWATQMVVGQFGDDERLRNAGFQQWASWGEDFTGGTYSYSGTRLVVPGVFEEGYEKGAIEGILSGDFAENYPGDELLIYGSPDLPTTGCQRVLDTTLERLWVDSAAVYEPMATWAARRFIIGMHNESTDPLVVLVSYETGEVVQQIELEYEFSEIEFFTFGQGGTSAGHVGKYHDTAIVYSFDQATDVPDEAAQLLPRHFTLKQNYPNPFNGETTIAFSLGRKGQIRAVVYNLLGQEVAVLADREFGPGEHTLRWDGSDSSGEEAASGIYLFKITTDDEESRSIRMVYVK